VNISGVVSKLSDPDKTSSSYHHEHYATKKIQPQQQQIQRVSRTRDDDDERRQSLHESYPSRRRVRSFESPFLSGDKEIYYDVPVALSSENADFVTSKDSHGRLHFLKYRRRKPKHDTEQHDTMNAGSITSDTVASGGYAPNQQSSSDHDRKLFSSHEHQHQPHRRDRSRSFDQSLHPSRDKEIIHDTNTGSNTPDTVVSGGYTPNKPVSRRIQRVTSFSSDDMSSSCREADLPATKLKPIKLRFKQKYENDHHQTTRNVAPQATKDRIEVRMGKRSCGNTKTVIMDGNIVVSKPHNSKPSNDAVTITSTASSKSKAKAMRRKSERNARAASALDDKGNDLFEKGYFDRAMACYTKALKLKRRTFAHLLEETDDLEEELILRDDSGNLADPQALVSMATSINNIGYLRQRSGDATPEETMAAYKKSLRIKRRILGNDSLSVGKTLNNIGSVHYLKRDFERALAAYDEALEIMKATLGDKHPDVATVMSNIGDVYLAQDNKAISTKYYRLALVIRWEAFGERSPRVVRLLEKISNLEIGDMSCQLTSQKTNNTAWGDDVASDVMVGSDWQPVSEALKLLQEQIKNDIEQVDQMERNAPVETLKDRIIIIRGMRDVWNGSGPELLDNDSASVQTAMSRLSGR
jgi:tetratricopeptide (TPR) repeat protein